MTSILRIVAAFLLLAGHACAQTDRVGRVPDALRESLNLAPFYRKHLDLETYAILGSERVSDAAMLEAAWILRRMLAHRPEILRTLASQGARLVVMAHDEYTTDIPEQAGMTPKVFWDRRARGLGGRITSCAEENLLGFPGDPYSTENILIHEFAHVVHGVAMRALDPTFDPRLRTAYSDAMAAGKWAGTYAASNPGEYWAEGVQSWFDDNRENDALHNHVNTRRELREYDPALAALCEEVFGDGTWRYRKPFDRPASERVHLGDHDPAATPRFRWREAPVPDKPRVSIQTALGNIEVELDTRSAPITVTNFLRYVHEGLYSDGEFWRISSHPDPEESGDEPRPDPRDPGDGKPRAHQRLPRAHSPRTNPRFRPPTRRRRHLHGTIRCEQRAGGLLHLHLRPARTRLRGPSQPGRTGLRRLRQGR